MSSNYSETYRLVNNFKIALNNHTYSNLLLYPFGYDYNQYTEDNDTFESLSEFLVMDNGYQNILSSDLYPAAGDSDDFMYGMLTTETGETRDKIFAMTPEIGSSFWPAAIHALHTPSSLKNKSGLVSGKQHFEQYCISIIDLF